MKAASLAPPAGRRRRVFWVGEFSTGEVGKFQPALTIRPESRHNALLRGPKLAHVTGRFTGWIDYGLSLLEADVSGF